MPAGNPGAKAAETIVASLHSSPLHSTTTRRRNTTHTPATSYYLCEDKKQCFYFSDGEKNKISNYISGSDHIGLCCEKDIYRM